MWYQWVPCILRASVLLQLQWYKWTLPQFLHQYKYLAKCEILPEAPHQSSHKSDHFDMLVPFLDPLFQSTCPRWTEKWRLSDQRDHPKCRAQDHQRALPKRWRQSPTKLWWQIHERSCSGGMAPRKQKWQTHTTPRCFPTRATNRSSKHPKHLHKLPWCQMDCDSLTRYPKWKACTGGYTFFLHALSFSPWICCAYVIMSLRRSWN